MAILLLVAVASASLVGCASERAAHGDASVSVPDQSVLDPATQALDKAVQANADQFAPETVAAARRRITLARDVLFSAARAHRPLNDSERQRVDDLVAAAKLDAREALVETQAKAVRHQLDQLQGTGDTADQSAAGDASALDGDADNSNSGLGMGLSGADSDDGLGY
ncbi:hypothetical protein [Salinisphaera sp. Q1T1-3]|uniref:hypothetical protein n=1 Tax=Salinisphaera sp. Q1T1-3 TaxID=2321229 RepID=UPI000E7212F9|nr:hypothetical protein [Salinisphaera sp. Q1T1-3]RJS93996.1 hypothetical protein D3260_05315 [Salinisphaera sp. Q1T1-3]